MPCWPDMKILPSRTEPTTLAVPRRHTPRLGAYGLYRPCLRWEFGFTCAFCLTHETDLVEHGVRGWGLEWIEHLVPRSVDEARIDDYSNCYLSCRFCNEARSDTPNVDKLGRRLLDPCVAPWADHFLREGDSLEPRVGDPDAEYTWATYDFDDERKKVMRRTREARLEDALLTLREGPERVRRLLALAEKVSGADSDVLLREAEHLDALLRQTRKGDRTLLGDPERPGRFLPLPE